MKKINWIIFVVIYLMITNLANAQNEIATDVQKESRQIAIAVAEPSYSILNESTAQILNNRLNQAIALNGLGSVSKSAKFLLVPSVTLISKDVTTNIPQQFVVEVEVVFFIVDNSRKTVLQQEAITVKGIGTTEAKAMNKAISSIQARNSRLKNLIVKGKEKIVAYYEDQCETLMKSIQSYIDRKMYFEAYFELNAVPHLNNNTSCYDRSLELLKQLDEQEKQEAEAKMESQTNDVDWVTNGTPDDQETPQPTENQEE